MSAAAFMPPVAAPGHSRRFIATMVFVLGALSATAPIAIDLYLPAFPAMADALGSPESRIQLTLTSMMIGMGLGQAFIGPLSDRIGRRKPLLIGMMVFTVTSLVCTVAQSADLLIAMRFLQGLSGAAGVVVARAVIRDHFAGDDMTRFTAKMMFVTMLAPMLGPIVGAQLIRFGPWQTVFVFMAALSVLTTFLVWKFLPESLPAQERRAMGGREFAASLWTLVRDARFIAPTLVVIMNFSMLFTYVSTFSFISQNELGASAGFYSLLFALGTLALLAGNQTNMLMIDRSESHQRMIVGMAISLLGVAWIAGVQFAGAENLWTVPAGIVLMMFGCGVVFPNAGAAAMSSQPPQIAGTASAFMGSLQMGAGGAMPALATIGGVTLVNMTIGIGVYALATAAAVVWTILVYRREPAAAEA
ncbi:multidrug effflux MFS transporter [Glycomyces rutgersensis]|uniref:DHA1 family bicyclomycin/chloramphenicol resistance-like MFS transporter n=4 Tax=Glycomycetaceae TaxID=85034 RepID=A0A9X3PMJ3_9ACTN|nr:multidrug effflux MFS transporter [Glycomyces lechevalierae]MDA1386531.1 multidrug effflux MFS transporter [Glycomyces lechevalierae]MDR7340598.1 DHA1 family bicyclomycin/chloramphenicol resistance-like MFS transporter [Glycomyces lechevalierae]